MNTSLNSVISHAPASQPQTVEAFSISDFKALYATFDEAMLARLPLLYHTDIVFKDPIHAVVGLNALHHYFANFCNPNTHCKFEFTNEVITQNQAFLQWQMEYRHAQIKGGTPISLNGGTLIKYDTKISYHEDFYDMGAMIYQHLPIMGWAVKKINARITGQQP